MARPDFPLSLRAFQLDLSYNAAWLLLHKLRRAMVVPDREKLSGIIEMDETWVGGPQAGLRGSRQLKGRKAALVIVAVERRGTGSGRVRMEVIPDFTQEGNMKQWLLGTFHGVSRAQLQAYLNEFVFRHNRRGNPQLAFQTLLGLGTNRAPVPLSVVREAADLPQFPILP